MNPRVMVTRRWPCTVEKILAERFDVALNADARPLDAAEMMAALQDLDAVLPTVSDRLPAIT